MGEKAKQAKSKKEAILQFVPGSFRNNISRVTNKSLTNKNLVKCHEVGVVTEVGHVIGQIVDTNQARNLGDRDAIHIRDHDLEVQNVTVEMAAQDIQNHIVQTEEIIDEIDDAPAQIIRIIHPEVQAQKSVKQKFVAYL